MFVEVRNFIDGELRDSVDKNTVDIENPATDKVVGSLPKSNLEDVELGRFQVPGNHAS